MPAGVIPSTSSSRSQRSRIFSGVRQDMPPLITVEPPTARPSAKVMDGLPIVICAPPSRYRRLTCAATSVVNSSVGW
jgi:hypothetical protein